MRLPACAVIERTCDWLVVAGDQIESIDLKVSARELAVFVGIMFKRAGLKQPNCVLAPGSTSCFFATMDIDDDVGIRDRSALVYELEDHLPIDAESMVADFMVVAPGKTAKRVAAVAIEINRWRQITDELELAGVSVKSIVPSVALAAGVFSEQVDPGETTALVLVDGVQCDWILISRESMFSWKHLAVDAATLRRHQKLSPQEVGRIVVYGAEPDTQSIIEQSIVNADFSEDPVDSLVIKGTESVLASRWGRWFDLRRDALGPNDPLAAIKTQLRWVGVAAAACLLALAVGPWWRSRLIESEIDTVRSQQQTLFQQAFPESNVPGALLRRVRSEHTKVLGSRGKTSSVEIPQSAPKVLRHLLHALPSDVRFRITRLNIADGSVDFDLQVQRAVDAGKVATALSGGGFEVSPPGTTQIDANTYESLIRADWTEETERDATPANEVSLMEATSDEAAG